MGTGSPASDIIARLKVVIDRASVTAAIADIQTGLKQLTLPQNKVELQKIIDLGDINKQVAEIQRMGAAVNALSAEGMEKEKAAQLVNDFLTKQRVQNDQQKLKSAEELANSLVATFGRIEKADQQTTQAAIQSGQNFIQALSQANIGGIWKQFTSGAMGDMNIPGGFAQMGGGILKSLGIDPATNITLSATTGGVLALGQAIMTLGEDYLAAYRKGQQWLSQTEQLRKQIGLTADQATQQRSLMVFSTFGQADSPFANIVFSQLQANLQMVVDLKNGLIATNPQIQKMADGMQRLGLDARDANGQVKDVVQFTLEMSRALQGMDPARYSQAIQEISGLFGINFASVAGTAPGTLKELIESSVKVGETQLRMADERTAAIQMATNAEMQFNLALTGGIAPLDIMLQRMKQIFFLALSGNPGGQTPMGIPKETMDWLTTGLNVGAGLLNWALPGAMFAVQQIGKVQAEAGKQTQAAIAQDLLKSPLVALKEEQLALQAISKLVQTGMDADTQAAKNYSDALRQVGVEAQRAAQDQSNLNKSLTDAATSFDKSLTGVISSAKTYDTMYRSYEDTYKKIDDLTTKSNSFVKTYSYKDPKTGETTALTGSLKDIEKYYKDFNVEAAGDLKQAEINQASAEKMVAKAETTKKKTLTATQSLTYNWLVTGTDPVAMVREKWDTKQLAERAVALGIPEGAQVTTETLVSSWVKRGLSEAERNQLEQAWEQIKTLNQQNAELGFNTLVKGMGDYVKSLVPAKDALADVNGKLIDVNGQTEIFNNSALLMAQYLQSFATQAGLFESVGFDRALGEAALQAQLLNGEFGTGVQALETYYQKQKLIYDQTTKFADFISGRKTPTLETAIEAGILPEGAGTAPAPARRPKVYNPEVEYATPEEVALANLTRRYKEKQVSPQEFTQQLLQTAGVDVTAGILKIYDETFGKVKEKGVDAAKDLADQTQKALADTKFYIKLDITPETWTDLKQKIQDGLSNPPAGPSAGAKDAMGLAKQLLASMGFMVPEEVTTLQGMKDYVAGLTAETKQPGYQVPENLRNVLGPAAQQFYGQMPWNIPEGPKWQVTMGAVLSGQVVDDVSKQAFLKIQEINSILELEKDQVLLPSTVNTKQAMDDAPGAIAAVQQIADQMPVWLSFKYRIEGIPSTGPAGTGTGTGAGGEAVIPQGQVPTGTTGTGGATYTPPPKKPKGFIAPYGESGVGFISPFYDIPVYTAPSNRITGPSTNVNIDARGSTSPSDTARAVEKATGIFFSDDPQVAARDIRRRKGFTW